MASEFSQNEKSEIDFVFSFPSSQTSFEKYNAKPTFSKKHLCEGLFVSPQDLSRPSVEWRKTQSILGAALFLFTMRRVAMIGRTS
jgi:hypothetical protein